MIHAKISAKNGVLDQGGIYQTLTQGLAHKFSGQECLVLIPDHTRSLPLPMLNAGLDPR